MQLKSTNFSSNISWQAMLVVAHSASTRTLVGKFPIPFDTINCELRPVNGAKNTGAIISLPVFFL